MKTFIFAFLIILATALPATAQMMCGPRNNVVANLEKGYSEHPVSMGLASNGAVIEVFLSEAGTFTIVMTRPNGLSCLMAAGKDWQDLPIKPLLDPTALRISAQLESQPSCINGTFGKLARRISSEFPRATMRVIRGAVAERFIEQLAAVPRTMRRDKMGTVIGWETKANYVAIYSSEGVPTRLLILVADPCVVLVTALDNSHVDKMLEKALKRSGT